MRRKKSDWPKRQGPDDSEQGLDPEEHTERQMEREQEDQAYIPVILKRTDEALRHPDDVLEIAIAEGEEQLQRPLLSLALSALAAGLILGFSAMAVAVVESIYMEMAFQSSRVAVALVYPLGFVLCIMSGTQLFTEHTATAVYPVLDGRCRLTALLRLWGVVVFGNLLGAWLSAWLLVAVDPVVVAESGYLEIGRHLVSYGNDSLFVSAVLAGWLMALGAWLVMATQPTLVQMASIYIATFLIGLGGFHHSIAGSVEMFTAYLIGDEFRLAQVLRFIFMAVLGNLVGGSIFVALLNYAHIRQTQKGAGNGDSG